MTIPSLCVRDQVSRIAPKLRSSDFSGLFRDFPALTFAPNAPRISRTPRDLSPLAPSRWRTVWSRQRRCSGKGTPPRTHCPERDPKLIWFPPRVRVVHGTSPCTFLTLGGKPNQLRVVLRTVCVKRSLFPRATSPSTRQYADVMRLAETRLGVYD